MSSNQVRDWSEQDDLALVSPAPLSRRAILSVCVFFIANAASWALLTAVPALFAAFETTFAWGSVQLGVLRAVMAGSQFILAPMWGFYANKSRRKTLLVLECFLTGLFSLLMAVPSNFAAIVTLAAFAGASNGGIFPIVQGIVAELFAPSQRGQMYGLLNVASFVGVGIGFVFPTNVADTVMINGQSVAGWRVVFYTLGGVMMLCGLLVLLLATSSQSHEPATRDIGFLSQFRAVMSCRTWRLVVLQGCFGMIPWDAITFLVIWFEYIGFSRPAAGSIMLVAAFGAAMGAVFGGFLGDRASKSNPDTGRLSVGQISLVLSIPMAIIYLMLIPRNTDNFAAFCGVAFVMAFFCNWVGPACNEVVISEVVHPSQRSIAFSLDRMFEGTAGALGSILVGGIAALNGYTFEKPQAISQLPASARVANADALADALLIVCCVFWGMASLIFFAIRFTYPSDRDKVIMTPQYSYRYSAVQSDSMSSYNELPTTRL